MDLKPEIGSASDKLYNHPDAPSQTTAPSSASKWPLLLTFGIIFTLLLLTLNTYIQTRLVKHSETISFQSSTLNEELETRDLLDTEILVDIENRARLNACETGLNEDPATTWVDYENIGLGFKLKLPHNPAWGTSSHYLEAFEERFDDKANWYLLFGNIGGGEACGLGRDYKLESILSTSSIQTSPRQINPQGITIVTIIGFYDDVMGCNFDTYELISPKSILKLNVPCRTNLDEVNQFLNLAAPI